MSTKYLLQRFNSLVSYKFGTLCAIFVMSNVNAMSSKDQMSNVSKVLTVNSALGEATFA